MAWDDLYSLPDPEEERRQREAALAALAAGGGADGAAMAPDLEPPAQLEIPMSRADRVVELPEQTITADMAPETAPDPSLEDGSERFDWRAALAAEGNGAYQAAQSGTAPAEPRPGRGPSDALRSPTANELPSKDGQPAPASGQVKEAPPEQDPFEALARKGEQLQERRLQEMGEEPSVNGWAILADAVFNRGKSIPGMLQMVDNDKRAWREGRSRILQQGSGSDPMGRAMEYERIKNAREGLGLEKKRFEASQDKTAQAAEQEKIGADRFRAYAQEKGFYTPDMEDMSYSQLKAQFNMRGKDKDIATKEELGELNRSKSKGTRQGGIDATHENIDTIASDEEQKSAARARGAAPYQTARENHISPMEQARLDREAAAAERQTKRDAEADRKARVAEARQKRIEKAGEDTRSQARQQTFTKSVEKAVPVALELQKAEDLIAGYKSKTPKGQKTVIPGIGDRGHGNAFLESGRTPEWVRDAAIEWGDDDTRNKAIAATKIRGVLSNFEQDLIHNRSGAAFSANEEQMNRITAGTRAGAPLEAVELALETMHEIVQSKIGGFASVAPREAETSLTGSQLDPRRWGSTTWNPPTAAPLTPDEDDEWSQYEVR